MMLRKGGLPACLALTLILGVLFFPALIGDKTLLTSAWDAPSIVNAGAYHHERLPDDHIARSPDLGAPAWQTEPWLKVISEHYWTAHELPLWNPYAAYGAPLAANMQSQPYFPLAVLLSLNPTPWTYNFFIVARLLMAGALMFFYARLFLAWLPSLFAAVTFMLSGYFVLFLNMPHLSVEVLFPGVLAAFELLLRKNSWTAAAFTATMVFLSVVGGFPESTFLIVCFATVYFFVRLLLTPELRERPYSRSAKLAGGLALGFALAAFLLLPFFEFARIAHDTHQSLNIQGPPPAFAADENPPSLLLQLLPMSLGPVGNPSWPGMLGYWGMLPCFFAVTAMLCWFFPRRVPFVRPQRSLTAFFAIMTVLMLLKRFGHPIIQWIGYLPLSGMVVYLKYQEPLLALCIAMLAGIGFSLLAAGRAKTTYFLVSAAIVLDVMFALAIWSIPLTLTLGDFSPYYYVGVLSGLLAIFGAVWLIAIVPPVSLRARSLLAGGLFGISLIELSLNFILPNFYVLNTLPSTRADPYAGAPYIDFLRARNAEYYRVFGREGILYPNWAGVFRLEDVRSLDALYYFRYRDFIRSFLLHPGDERRNGDLADRFTGSDLNYTYDFDSEIEKRFLALSSVKYLISASEYGANSIMTDQILSQHAGEKRLGFGAASFPVDASGKLVRGFMQHPPSERIAYKTVIDPQRPVFEAVAAIMKAAQDKSDGAGFLLEIGSDGNIEKLFSTVLNPKDIPADRAGRPVRVDLSAYAGKEVELLFSTDPGPSGNSAYDWAGWAKPRFVSTADTANASSFKELYDREVYIYEVPWVLPRAALFSAVEILPEAEVLARLKDPAFNLAEKIILSRESLSNDDLASARLLPAAVSARPVAAHIDSFRSQQVRIEAETAAPAVLMLTDSNYPGWRAYVNGKPAPILHANYLFRAVFLPAGKNTVEFAYEPASFRWGVFISGAALVIILVLVLYVARNHRSVTRPM